MAQIFPSKMNILSKASIVIGAVLAGGGLALVLGLARSPYVNMVGIPREQPVPFSHKHHVNGLGLDCRYCHTSVEDVAFAGIPPVKTCMTCHSQIWTEAPILEPIRASYRTDKAIEWIRVHDLPDFVYFNHSIHVRKGVGCESCHGRVDQMPLMMKANSLDMQWCIACHKQPEQHLRPRDAVFQMGWKPEGDQLALGETLLREHHVDKAKMLNCSICHR
ncbi:MAG: cytochrome c3 family protein [Deltaproteobacteria bacterium]|nr:cytochrome c3 family protein [Deltaproteobacteria bacterium]